MVSSQIDEHKEFGGVVPELAARAHLENIEFIIDKSLKDARINLNEIDGVSATAGPGLIVCLTVGLNIGKSIAAFAEKPFVGVNHLEAHIFANFLAEPHLEFPFVCLLVSGGHTQIWQIKNINDYRLLGETRDDAAGEAFDKGARILGLGYPGGPEIEKKAKEGNPLKIDFPRILLDKKSLDFSFSGLKTSLLYYFDNFEESENITVSDVAASYQMAIVETLIEKVKRALAKTKYNRCVIAGGVAANTILREKIKEVNPQTDFVFPELSFCTDNAAMISFLAEIKLNSQPSKSFSDFSFGSLPNLRL